uniref:N(4)-(Beta-N-acetylglucosaminyl)-L-asparaginase n=1 Tax=Caenorhabditis tropicalis TaxID=1561998 RepID=A0A1I7TCN9_9PELO
MWFLVFSVCFLSNLNFSLGYGDDNLPVVITTWGSDGFEKATKKAVDATLLGGRMYGLVEGLSTCEALQCDTTVGYGGSPDENGETCLDALVFDAEGMRVGAVANLHRIRDAAKVAWGVMNYTKHTLLVGESATQFAKSIGFVEQELATNETKSWIESWKNGKCQPNFWKNVSPDPSSSCGPYKPNPSVYKYTSVNEAGYLVEKTNHDTIGMVVLDLEKKISAGTSSNGARFKIPGRVGDSPVPGAGAYANSFGGAAATGDGDVMMRFLPSFYTVSQMELGTKPGKATTKAIKRILAVYPKFSGAVVAMNSNGNFGVACANINKFGYNVAYRNGTVFTFKIACLSQQKTFSENLDKPIDFA